MKSFKRYLNETTGSRYTYSEPEKIARVLELKKVITSEPFNYTWDYKIPSIIPMKSILVAQRDLDRSIVTTPSLDTNIFRAYLHNYSDDYIYFEADYPAITWNQFSGFTDADPIDFEKYPLFKSSTYTTYRPEEMFIFSDADKKFHSFAVYDYYQLQPGTKPEKIISTLEYIREYWISHGWWNETDDMLLLKAKFRYLPKEKLTKRDFIKGALMDI